MKDEIKTFFKKCRQVSDALNMQTFLPRPVKVNFTLPVSAWTAIDDKYYADINIVGVTENDDAEIDFDAESLVIVLNADIEGVGESLSDKLRIYAKNIPTGQITGFATITKGVR